MWFAYGLSRFVPISMIMNDFERPYVTHITQRRLFVNVDTFSIGIGIAGFN